MSTSLFTGIIPFAESLYGVGTDPVDTVAMRDGVANGLLHCADSRPQVRVNYWPLDSGVSNNVDNYLTIDTPDNADQWYLMEGFPMGPWPLTVRPDGTPCRLRILVAGAVSSAAGGPVSSFRIVIAPSFREAEAAKTLNDDHVYRCTATSTTPGVITGDSGGDLGAATYVQVSREQARAWTRRVPIVDAVSSGSDDDVEQVLVSAWVWAATTAVGSLPRLHGLYLAEFHQP